MARESKFEMDGELWVFGYGSLIWRPDLAHVEKRDGFIRGWKRRFWQGSTDHRGTPEAPGRVVTLVSLDRTKEMGFVDDQEDEEWLTYGVAYRIPDEEKRKVLDQLDYREKDGYERHVVSVYDYKEPDRISVPRALIYIANDENPQWMGGQAGLDAIAKHIAVSKGPSGPNPEYLFELAKAVKAKGVTDKHLEELSNRVHQLLLQSNSAS
mmetsp:Transcript_21864/g.88989  ORF Transcript_21864/g.88989 Transcript_21864/m.88989 type:complete len:210 (-) Transcript_21864:56-685(-)|eukprot:CAMPEP_0113965646 /NCGR_PEP_ID=MMETSP0011_2-20120614/7863_1 /TAXON_ID=101924 /ORGANISM="Rhodosorus marinus" /LENGTH=209 /DNA_ID=CAMNT_0000978187 /DNA_START=87 /DNA_END=716 /DNA_ORIENTATION=+ /assembly_acc=CAM_ASM_000156